jgi:hypothetical protein
MLKRNHQCGGDVKQAILEKPRPGQLQLKLALLLFFLQLSDGTVHAQIPLDTTRFNVNPAILRTVESKIGNQIVVDEDGPLSVIEVSIVENGLQRHGKGVYNARYYCGSKDTAAITAHVSFPEGCALKGHVICWMKFYGDQGRIYLQGRSEGDKTFKLTKSDPLDDRIFIPCAYKHVVLSEKPAYGKEDIISGMAEVRSEVYYLVRNGEEIKCQLRLKTYYISSRSSHD